MINHEYGLFADMVLRDQKFVNTNYLDFNNCDLTGSTIDCTSDCTIGERRFVYLYKCVLTNVEFIIDEVVDRNYPDNSVRNRIFYCDMSTVKGLTHQFLQYTLLTGSILPTYLLKDVPVVPDLDQKILDVVANQRELFNMGRYHNPLLTQCGTSHCRAGWAITFGGEEAASLEFKFNPALAGALIYSASRPGKPVPDFYCTDAMAIADMVKSCRQGN